MGFSGWTLRLLWENHRTKWGIFQQTMFDYWWVFGCHRKICESAPRIPWVEGWTSNFQLIILMFTRVPVRWSIAIWGNQATVLTGCVFPFLPASLRSFAGKKSGFCLGPRGNGTRIRKFASRNNAAACDDGWSTVTRAGSAQWWLPLGEEQSNKLESR